MQVYNVRKLHFQANLCEVFAEDKQQRYCGDLSCMHADASGAVRLSIVYKYRSFLNPEQ